MSIRRGHTENLQICANKTLRARSVLLQHFPPRFLRFQNLICIDVALGLRIYQCNSGRNYLFFEDFYAFFFLSQNKISRIVGIANFTRYTIVRKDIRMNERSFHNFLRKVPRWIVIFFVPLPFSTYPPPCLLRRTAFFTAPVRIWMARGGGQCNG